MLPKKSVAPAILVGDVHQLECAVRAIERLVLANSGDITPKTRDRLTAASLRLAKLIEVTEIARRRRA